MPSAIPELVARIALKWMDSRPFSEESRARRKARRAARRSGNQEEFSMLPQGKGTYTGAAVGIASVPIGIAVTMISPSVEGFLVANGIAPEMCAPDASTCVTASAMALALVSGVLTTVGGAIVAWGKRRSNARHAAELAAAKAAPTAG